MFHGKVSLPEDVDISNKLIKYHDFNINQKAQRERERARDTPCCPARRLDCWPLSNLIND